MTDDDQDDQVDPFALLTGLRKERRGPIPAHGDDGPRMVVTRLTGDEARELARHRLEAWRYRHAI